MLFCYISDLEILFSVWRLLSSPRSWPALPWSTLVGSSWSWRPFSSGGQLPLVANFKTLLLLSWGRGSSVGRIGFNTTKSGSWILLVLAFSSRHSHVSTDQRRHILPRKGWVFNIVFQMQYSRQT